MKQRQASVWVAQHPHHDCHIVVAGVIGGDPQLEPLVVYAVVHPIDLFRYFFGPPRRHLRPSNTAENPTRPPHVRNTLYRLNNSIGNARSCRQVIDSGRSPSHRSMRTGPSARYACPRASRTKSWKRQPLPGDSQ